MEFDPSLFWLTIQMADPFYPQSARGEGHGIDELRFAGDKFMGAISFLRANFPLKMSTL